MDDQEILIFMKDLDAAVIINSYPDLGDAYDGAMDPAIRVLRQDTIHQQNEEKRLQDKIDALVPNQERYHEIRENLQEFQGDTADNQIIIQLRLAAIAEMRLVNLYRNWEVSFKRMVKQAYHTEDRRLFNWEKIIELLRKVNIDASLIPGFIELNELRMVVNAIKHAQELEEEIKLIPEFAWAEQVSYNNGTNFYMRVEPQVNQFYAALSQLIFNSLYPYPDRPLVKVIPQFHKLEWEDYSTPDLDPDDLSRKECLKLDKIFHVAHLETAVRIIKDGRVKAGLIFDSKLNKQRILVVWLSPNAWSNGSRYGNIAFEMNFCDLIRGRNFYWIEPMLEYSPTALRILITNKKYTNLQSYDPAKDKGPWRYDPVNDVHFWNGTYCLEFMLEADVDLKDFTALQSINHHKNQCCIDPYSCLDKDQTGVLARDRFIAAIISNKLAVHVLHFGHYSDLTFEANDFLRESIGNLAGEALRYSFEFTGPLKFNDSVAPFYIEALLHLYYIQDLQGFKSMVNQFATYNDYRGALIIEAVKRFHLSHTANLNWPPLNIVTPNP
jgi:hypothetical protein